MCSRISNFRRWVLAALLLVGLAHAQNFQPAVDFACPYFPTTSRFTLALAIDVGLTVTVAPYNAAILPPTSFPISIDLEQMLVTATAGPGLTVWTVTRGYNGTTIAGHQTTALIQLVCGTITALNPTVPVINIGQAGHILLVDFPTAIATVNTIQVRLEASYTCPTPPACGDGTWFPISTDITSAPLITDTPIPFALLFANGSYPYIRVNSLLNTPGALPMDVRYSGSLFPISNMQTLTGVAGNCLDFSTAGIPQDSGAPCSSLSLTGEPRTFTYWSGIHAIGSAGTGNTGSDLNGFMWRGVDDGTVTKLRIGAGTLDGSSATVIVEYYDAAGHEISDFYSNGTWAVEANADYDWTHTISSSTGSNGGGANYQGGGLYTQVCGGGLCAGATSPNAISYQLINYVVDGSAKPEQLVFSTAYSGSGGPGGDGIYNFSILPSATPRPGLAIHQVDKGTSIPIRFNSGTTVVRGEVQDLNPAGSGTADDGIGLWSAGVTFAVLTALTPPSTNGTLTYCRDCLAATHVCTNAGGHGTWASYQNGAWYCF